MMERLAAVEETLRQVSLAQSERILVAAAPVSDAVEWNGIDSGDTSW